MKRRLPILSTIVVAIAMVSSTAFAGSLSGNVKNASMANIPGILVTAYVSDGKGVNAIGSATTDASGNYSIVNLPADTYYLHARMAPGITGNYGDEWYDVVAPTSGGYVGADADGIAILDTDDLTGYDFQLAVQAGIDGTVVNGANAKLQGMIVRTEATNDYRVHHNDVTDGPCCVGNPHLGNFYMRGLPSDVNGPTTYMGIIYDPSGAYATGVFGPWSVTNSTNAAVGNQTLTPFAADTHEPNDNPTAAGADSITGLPFVSTGAYIGPLNADVDWHCANLLAGDRVIATAKSEITVNGVVRDHPWSDPILSFWTGDRATRIAENDDADATTRGSLVDTGEIPADGRYCFAVSMFGDSDYDGDEHQSVGAYVLDVEMGNRRPTLDVTYQSTPVADLPMGIMVSEGETFSVEFAYGDPENDMVMVTVTVTDANGNVVAVGNVNLSNGTGTFDWMVSQTAAQEGPYTITVSATDGEFTTEQSVAVGVEAVNLPPTTPVLLTPSNMTVVMTRSPDLVLENSTDPDLDALVYEYEVYFGPVDFTPDLASTVAEDMSGMTTLATSNLPENAEVSWRARAFDGGVMAGYSAWSAPFTFIVDSVNDPPTTPEVLKPTAGEVLMTRTPAIAVSPSTDPEGEDISFEIEVAEDDGFGSVLSSGTVAMETNSDSTEWSVADELEWGRSYWVRARAVDARGAMSGWSPTVQFGTFDQFTPDVPGFGEPFQSQCNEAVLTSTEGITIPNIMGDQVFFDIQIFNFGDDPESATPVFELTVEQAEGTETFVPLTGADLAEDGHYTIRLRATRGERQSEWAACDFYLNADDQLPPALTFLSPADGSTLPAGTRNVDIEIESPSDPDGHPVDIAICASTNPEFSSCDADPANWERIEPTGQVTQWSITGLLDGDTQYVQGCAIDGFDRCGPVASISFSIGGESGSVGADEGCGCANGGPGQAGPAALLLALMMVVRRRRRD